MFHTKCHGGHQFYPHMLYCCKIVGQSVLLQSKENLSLHISMVRSDLQGFGRVSSLRPHLPGLADLRRLCSNQKECKLH